MRTMLKRTVSVLVMCVAALVVGGTAYAVLLGCGSAPENRKTYEYDRVVVIPKLDTELISSKTRKPAGERGEGASESASEEKTRAHTAVWLARYRWEPWVTKDNEHRRSLATIEIIFCPFDQADFTRCRIGVAWSRRTHPLGDQRVLSTGD